MINIYIYNIVNLLSSAIKFKKTVENSKGIAITSAVSRVTMSCKSTVLTSDCVSSALRLKYEHTNRLGVY